MKLIAATPSAPVPCPTKMPSIAVTADIDIVPSNVGNSNFLNRTDTFSFAKSIASLFISYTLNR